MLQKLLEHYTSLGQHHRQKLNFLAGVYLAIGQVLIFTPATLLDQMKTNLLSQNQFIPDILVFGGSLIALLSLVSVGILHHLANLITNATLRLNYERRLLVKDLQSISDLDRDFELQLRTHHSLSKISAVIGAGLSASIFVAVNVRLVYLILYLFSDTHGVYLFIGAFIMIQSGLLILYGVVIWNRAKAFYKARKFLKCIEIGKTDSEIVKCLNECGISTIQGTIKAYRTQ